MLREYAAYFNQLRPPQGRDQRGPMPAAPPGPARYDHGASMAFPALGGLRHTYRRAA